MFCNYCGAQNPDDSNFCSKCGRAFNKIPHPADNNPTKYKLNIFRISQLYLVNPPINISITHDNHTDQMSIENGQNLSLSLEKGEYQITFYQSFRKKHICVNMDQDRNITVKWNRLTGAIELSLE